MHQKVTECLEIYKQELKKYKKFVDEVKRAHGGKIEDWMAELSNYEYDKATEWAAQLDKMAAVLGLTKAEVTAIEKKMGLDS